ncbi:hypothetical protein BRC81_02045 [Halobacteriales archaeon QS_1_68_20]|nr:MAG: hypothetical protein BRC81_02045 [Halobacteriales archaeon QS_1_68_20]
MSPAGGRPGVGSELGRREFLAATGLAVGASLGGCSENRETPEPLPEVTDGDWPMVHRSRTHRRTLPDASAPSSSPSEVWRREFDPIVNRVLSVGDRLLVGVGASLSTYETRTVALDPETGETLWDRPERLGNAVVDGTMVRGGSAVVARDLEDGAVRWRHETPTVRGGVHGDVTKSAVAYPPAVHDGTVYVAVGAPTDIRPSVRRGGLPRVLALDLATGERRWTYRFEEGTEGVLPTAVTVDADRIYVADRALDPASGEPVWRYRADADRPEYAPPTVGRDVAYLYATASPFVAAVDAETGETEWRTDAVPAGADADCPVTLADGRVYCGGVALDAGTGDREWSQWEHAGVHAPVGERTYTVRRTDGLDPVAVAVDAATGEPAWKEQLLPEFDHSRFLEPPVVGDGRVYVAGSEANQVSGAVAAFE